MMELTKDNVVITSDGDIFIPVIGFRDIKSRLPQGKELKQQLIDDYEKARQLDKFIESNLPSLMNFKLRELIEKRIEENESYKNDPDSGGLYYELQNLLEESKK